MKYWKAGLAGALIVLPLAALASGPRGGDGAGDGPGWGRHSGHHGGFPGSRMIEMLQQMDTDRNGVISAEEFRIGHQGRLDRVDADGDGQVTLEEMEAFAIERMRDRVAERFGRLDADGDGVVTVEEFAAQADARFARMDRDGDGNLTIHDLPMRGHGGRGGPMSDPLEDETPQE